MAFQDDQRVWVVDTFCDQTYRGNPAAVLLLERDYPATDALLATAARLALPTTAFVKLGPEEGHDIRWFTPEQELNLCGHASIASARVLFDRRSSRTDREIRFATQFGTLTGEQFAPNRVALTLPTIEVTPMPSPPGLETALGAAIVQCGRSVDDLVIELESQQAVASLVPDLSVLRALPWRGHVVTARAESSDADFVSRSFFPALGVDEDQVCVSAHCKLARYWGERLDKREMVALQLSSRGGVLALRLAGDSVQVVGSARIRRETTLAAEAALAGGGHYRD